MPLIALCRAQVVHIFMVVARIKRTANRIKSYAKKRGKVSTSGIQRRLRISYPRAARLMEQMEEMGIVGPQVSAGRKRRVILGDDEL